MNSSLPKVLHPIANKPMLGHVLQSASQANENIQPCVVVGHGGQVVEQYLSNEFPQVKIAIQHEQKGTGHAVMQAMPVVANSGPTTILYGDVPLIQAKSLNKLAEFSLGGALVILTQILDDPTGYGRIIRNLDGEVVGIVEEKDATSEQRKIQEINTGILCCDTQDLKRWLEMLTPNNAQGEFYLTDIIAFAAQEGVPIRTLHPEYDWEVQGVNSRLQLASLEREYQSHLANQLLINGVTLADPARIDIRGSLSCQTDIQY
jgi:bifunctional UDP-N-acetylglucosamine pyrophosphorylase/glucosamine-1-phosphate N-acetyltransferase